MLSFKPYQPYEIDLELANKSLFRIMDHENRLIAELPFLDALRDVLNRHDEYEVDGDLIPIKGLVIREKNEARCKVRYDPPFDPGNEIRIEAQKQGDACILKLFQLCLEVGKEGWIRDWVWYYVEKDRVIEDPGTSFFQFFIGQYGKILRDTVTLYDIPDGLLKQKEDPFFYTDSERQMAETRRYYEDFLKNTRYGQLLLNRMKNERDMKLFGSMSPLIDDIPLDVVVTRMNDILKEMRWQRWILFVAFIVIAAIYLFK